MPISNQTEARDTISSIFKTAWDAGTESDGVLVIYDDSGTEKPTENVPFVEVFIEMTGGTRKTIGGKIGGRKFKRLGLVTVVIRTPYGDGVTLSDALCKITTDMFEDADVGCDGITFRDVHTRTGGQDGPWFQANVVCSFDYEETR